MRKSIAYWMFVAASVALTPLMIATNCQVKHTECSGGCDGTMEYCEKQRAANYAEPGKLPFVNPGTGNIWSGFCKTFNLTPGSDDYRSASCDEQHAPVGYQKIGGGGCTVDGLCCYVKQDVFDLATKVLTGYNYDKLNPNSGCTGSGSIPE